jgi:hypothetical protein
MYYHTSTIITRGLYIFTPFLKTISLFSRRFFRKFCPYVRLVFKSGFYSRAGYDGACTYGMLAVLHKWGHAICSSIPSWFRRILCVCVWVFTGCVFFSIGVKTLEKYQCELCCIVKTHKTWVAGKGSENLQRFKSKPTENSSNSQIKYI